MNKSLYLQVSLQINRTSNQIKLLMPDL